MGLRSARRPATVAALLLVLATLSGNRLVVPAARGEELRPAHAEGPRATPELSVGSNALGGRSTLQPTRSAASSERPRPNPRFQATSLPALHPAAPSADRLTLVFAGDIMDHPINFARRPYSRIYAAVSPMLHEADLAFANLEFTIRPGHPFSGWPRFSVQPDYVQAAIDAGFNVFSDANNHVFDFGRSGVESTFGAMERFALTENVNFSGIRAIPQEPMEPITIDVKGFRIGYLAVTEFLNYGLKDDLVNVVDYRDPSERERFIDYLRSVIPRYDLFILSVHGGVEYDLSPEPAKEIFFREAVDAGVGIVWSQHPHVLEPWETVDAGGVRHLIIYSNGNFISGQTSEIDPDKPWLPRTFTGDSALFRVKVGRVDGKVTVLSVDPVLISNYKDAEGQMVVRPLATLAREELPRVWQTYYRYRYEVMKMLIAPWNDFARGGVAEPGSFGPAAMLLR